ncbi:hypothetical protein SDC9_55043 [bioreactor metagenome]|uniref:HTH cro/C1-type domain-containing protein n=1 Tax=bioreactor metagenome TaxID=1076179 RepID=A0A644WY52_9ZZZZ
MSNKNETIREALAKTMASRLLTQSETARRLGVSAALINNIVNGRDKTDPKLKISDDLWRKIAAFCGVSGWNTAETRDYKRIYALCVKCQQNSTSRAISFAPGSGKSHALKSYAGTHNNVYYIECDEYWSKKDFLRELRQQMGLVESGLSITEMVSSIIEYLNRTEMPLVIIDEADKLKDPVLNFFKTFYNKTTCGFVLCGAPYFQKRIMKGVRLQKQSYQEIYSRLGGEFFDMMGLNKEDIRKVCVANGISDDNDISMIANSSVAVDTLSNDNACDLRRVKAQIEKIKLEQSIKQA